MDFDNQKSGGFDAYADRATAKRFFRAQDRFTQPVTVASGQVLKALSFLQSDAAGKQIAYQGLTESTHVTFGTLASGLVLTLGGLSFTAGGSTVSAKDLAAAWASIADGGAGGTFTYGTFSGALTGWDTNAVDDDLDTTVVFNSVATNTNPTDLLASGTGAASATLDIVQGNTVIEEISGVLLFDVDATAVDVEATVFTKASFWAEALVWAVNPAVDTILLADGTEVACTAYNTGCYGESAASNLLKQKMVEGSNFTELGFQTVGV